MNIAVVILTLIASNLPGIVSIETLGYMPASLRIARYAILILAALYYTYFRNYQLAKYTFVLLSILVFTQASASLGATVFWQGLFDTNSFSGYFSGMVLLKLLSIIPLIALLLLLFDSPGKTYLVKGDLSVKAGPVRWLNIPSNWISWGKLATFSGFAIAGGTLFLTLFTVTGFSMPETIKDLPRHIPIILVLALVNSFSEGIIFRNAILASLQDMVSKEHLLLIAAAYFGLAHYYGAPSGVVGVIMSGVLGWWFIRSMYETGGLAAPWFIHFLQDVVIFTTLFLLLVFI